MILTINAGSSSIKYQVFSNNLEVVAKGLIEKIGEAKSIWQQVEVYFKDHKAAFAALGVYLKSFITENDLQGIGHRVVHGGDLYKKPVVINDQVLENIKSLFCLAPIHNPINYQGIKAMQELFPQTRQIAVFDSSFHSTLPTYASTYAIDKATAQKYAIKKYGFHGLNHEYVTQRAQQYLKKDSCNIINLHLGNGASSSLIKDGICVDTSMGLTPLAGLVMGTRCGDIDPAIVTYLAALGLSFEEIDTLLNKKSGLLGLCGDNDMRAILARNDCDAKLAVKIFVYSIQKNIGSYLSQMPKLDALVFTGGIGENSKVIRKMIVAPLAHFNLKIGTEDGIAINTKGLVPILVIPGNEEEFIAAQVLNF